MTSANVNDDPDLEGKDAQSVTLEGLTLSVNRLVQAPASEIFAILRNPLRHAELDPKGMNRAPQADSSDLIGALGDEFTLNMFAESEGGDYVMKNIVTRYERDSAIAWKPQSEPRDMPLGQQWTWLVEAVDDASTSVTLVYDWEDITEEEWLANNTFPHFPIETFTESVAALASAVERA
ncbi:MAG: polyketide cyclase [Gulosibacter sp.]|uniref:polyketide cyclase n=1 Tax=Gulosibacter sp. TaxID=2817531 RepID=UPI003F928615